MVYRSLCCWLAMGEKGRLPGGLRKGLNVSRIGFTDRRRHTCDAVRLWLVRTTPDPAPSDFYTTGLRAYAANCNPARRLCVHPARAADLPPVFAVSSFPGFPGFQRKAVARRLLDPCPCPAARRQRQQKPGSNKAVPRPRLLTKEFWNS